MVFNAFIGNTDDHLKNFSLLHDDDGFFLSPAYDLLPHTADRREHVLHFNAAFHYPGARQLIQLGKMVKIHAAETLMDEVKTVVADWEREFKQWRVPEKDIGRLAPGIHKRLSL